jgi:proline iminopeptidase
MTPDQHTNQEFYLEVGDGHELYIQDWGNPDARDVIFCLHGGPGGGTKPRHKNAFDPETQRVIFHDQRGCGKSLPYGSIEHNTTDNLVEDIEKIAQKLGLDQFVLTGGSWGSCLSLAYALKYPKRVKAMVLTGIFTGSQKEIDWLDQGQFQTFYPEVWERYLTATPIERRKNPSKYHFEKAFDDDAAAAKKSAYAYDNLEGGVIQLDDRFNTESFDEYDPTDIKIEIAYLKNRCFMADRHILDNAHKLTMPIYLVQGRYDMVCPPATAYELHQKLPNSKLSWALAGHKPEHETWNLMQAYLERVSE